MGKSRGNETLQDLRRKGLTLSEFWEALLKSSLLQNAWVEHYPHYQISPQMWKFFLDPKRKTYVLNWEKEQNALDPLQVHWTEFICATPELSFETLIHLRAFQRKAKEAIPFLRSILREGSLFLCGDVILLLGEMGRAALSEVSWIIKLVEESTDIQNRKRALKALIRIAPEDPRVHSHFLKELNTDNEEVRETASWSIGGLESLPSQEAVPVLMKLLNSSSDGILGNVAFALSRIGVEAELSVPLLIGALNTENEIDRYLVVKALGEIRCRDLQVLEALVRLFQQETHAVVRQNIVYALGQIGSDRDLVLSVLLTALNDPYYKVRRNAIWALSELKVSSTTNSLKELARDFQHKERMHRSLAAYALSQRQEWILKLWPMLKKLLLKKTEQEGNYWIFEIVTRCPTPDASIVSSLVKLLKRKEEDICQNAIWSLGKLGNVALSAVPKLKPFLTDLRKEIRYQAAEALSQIQPAVYEVIGVLQEGLLDEQIYLRQHSAYLLGNMGAWGKGAILSLQSALNDPNETVRYLAAEAIEKISGEKKELEYYQRQKLKTFPDFENWVPRAQGFL